MSDTLWPDKNDCHFAAYNLGSFSSKEKSGLIQIALKCNPNGPNCQKINIGLANGFERSRL